MSVGNGKLNLCTGAVQSFAQAKHRQSKRARCAALGALLTAMALGCALLLSLLRHRHPELEVKSTAQLEPERSTGKGSAPLQTSPHCSRHHLSISERNTQAAGGTHSLRLSLCESVCMRKLLTKLDGEAPLAAVAATVATTDVHSAADVHASLESIKRLVACGGSKYKYSSPRPARRIISRLSDPSGAFTDFSEQLHSSAHSSSLFRMASMVERAGSIDLMFELISDTANPAAIAAASVCGVPLPSSSPKVPSPSQLQMEWLADSPLAADGHQRISFGCYPRAHPLPCHLPCPPCAATRCSQSSYIALLTHVSPLCVSGGEAALSGCCRLGPFTIEMAGGLVPAAPQFVSTQQGRFLQTNLLPHTPAACASAGTTAASGCAALAAQAPPPAPELSAAPVTVQVEVFGFNRPCGLLRIEMLSDGALRGSRGVLVLPSQEMTEEVLVLEGEAQRALARGDDAALLAISSIVTKLGAWLDYTDSRQHQDTDALDDALDDALADLSGDEDAAPSGCSVRLSATPMLELASELLAYAHARDWAHVAQHVLRGIAMLGYSPPPSAMAHGSDSGSWTLCPGVVLSPCTKAEDGVIKDAVLQWRQSHSPPLSWTERHSHKALPLHLATAMAAAASKNGAAHAGRTKVGLPGMHPKWQDDTASSTTFSAHSTTSTGEICYDICPPALSAWRL